MSLRLGALLAIVGGTLSISAAEASAALEFCERASSGRSCATLTVPLDRSGTVPGTVKLRIERQKARRSTRPPLFLIADGPGESATGAFDSEAVEELVGTEARSRDIVVMDLRGTGGSGLLNCPVLQRASAKPADVTACAVKLGPGRDFYSSVDMAHDIDAVRDALGAERIAIYGVSHGTYLAQVYARSYPSRVDRLVLDSIVGPNGVDALQRSSMAAVPSALESICGKRGCRRFMRDPGGTVTRLAERLDRRPLRGYVVDRWGRRHRATIDGEGLMELASLYPLVLGPFPAAVAAAVQGDSAPLLRVRSDFVRYLRLGTTVPVRDSSTTSAIARLCADTALPWSATTPLEGRRAAVAALIDALPADAFAPFGRRIASASHVLGMCLGWPSSSRMAASLGPMPDVPALLLSGGADVSTPLADARALQALLPRSQLMVVPGAGHGVIEWEAECAGPAVRRFLAGGKAGGCPGSTGVHSPPPPTSLKGLRPTGPRGRAGRTVTAVKLTIVDGLQSLLMAAFLDVAKRKGEAGGRMPRTGGLRGGSYVANGRGFVLRRGSLVPGVRISGSVRFVRSSRARGSFQVTGKAAARGRLSLRGEVLRGTVGGRAVRVRFFLLERAFGIRSNAAQMAVGRSWAGQLLSPETLQRKLSARSQPARHAR